MEMQDFFFGKMKQGVVGMPPPTAPVFKRLSVFRSLADHVNKRKRNVRPGFKDHDEKAVKKVSTHKCPGGTIVIIYRREMTTFFKLFDDDIIQDFLWMDCCCKIADKYLLAMTFIYFKRANFSLSEYTRLNFFLALYLANTVEEDNEEFKYEIFPWALGTTWRKLFPDFIRLRDELWIRIGYRAIVSRRCCEEVMAIAPTHYIWQRERPPHHSGAVRNYTRQVQPPRGPTASPAKCLLCEKEGRAVPQESSSSCSSSSSDCQCLCSKNRPVNTWRKNKSMD